MIEFVFGTLTHVIILSSDVNKHFGSKNWSIQFWIQTIITGFVCHIMFQYIYFNSNAGIIIAYLYVMILSSFWYNRHNGDWIEIKDTIRAKMFFSYSCILVSSMLYMNLYQLLFQDKFIEVYNMTALFYLLSIPMYLTAIKLRKEGRKYVSNKNKSKTIGINNCNGSNACSDCKCNGHSNGSINKPNRWRLAQRISRFINRQENIVKLNLIGYLSVLFLCTVTDNLLDYFVFLASIAAIRQASERKLLQRGYYFKHCDIWKDCFSSTHLLFFVCLLIQLLSGGGIVVIVGITVIANFETLRRI